MELLYALLAFVLAIGVLVTVHEAGHFLVAKRLGVKVLRFSVGFGRPLWRHAGRDGTEYVLATIPLGGYVKMLDEREGEVPEAELPRAFNRQALWVRMAVVVAGPLANFLFAVLAFWLMFVIGVTGLRPLVESVEAGSLAERAGLRGGDEIVAVAGRDTVTWDRVVQALLDASLSGGAVELTVRGAEGRGRGASLDAGGLHLDELAGGEFFQALGVTPSRPRVPAVIGRVLADSPARQAGLEPGDRIIEAGGQPIEDWSAWVSYVRAHPEQTFPVEVERDGVRLVIQLRPGRAHDDQGQVIGRIGAEVARSAVSASDFYAREQYPAGQAVGRALTKTWEMTSLTLQFLWKMLMVEVSTKNLSGPISIAQFAGHSAQLGLSRFLEFLAIVSVSLGVLNLLPIPLLDGGHLMYYLIELFKGTPVSEEAQILGQRIGVAVLVGLMGLAFFNDFVRLLG